MEGSGFDALADFERAVDTGSAFLFPSSVAGTREPGARQQHSAATIATVDRGTEALAGAAAQQNRAAEGPAGGLAALLPAAERPTIPLSGRPGTQRVPRAVRTPVLAALLEQALARLARAECAQRPADIMSARFAEARVAAVAAVVAQEKELCGHASSKMVYRNLVAQALHQAEKEQGAGPGAAEAGKAIVRPGKLVEVGGSSLGLLEAAAAVVALGTLSASAAAFYGDAMRVRRKAARLAFFQEGTGPAAAPGNSSSLCKPV